MIIPTITKIAVRGMPLLDVVFRITTSKVMTSREERIVIMILDKRLKYANMQDEIKNVSNMRIIGFLNRFFMIHQKMQIIIENQEQIIRGKRPN